MIVRGGLALLAIVALVGAARDARSPAPPEATPAAGAPLGCFREGRFLNLDAALCAQVGGVPRPRGETAEETPKPRPVMRLRGVTLD